MAEEQFGFTAGGDVGYTLEELQAKPFKTVWETMYQAIWEAQKEAVKSPTDHNWQRAAFMGIGDVGDPSSLNPQVAARWFALRIRQLFPSMATLPLAGMSVIREDQAQIRGRWTYGVMNLFHYKPEGAAKLKYYDLFPLVIPFRRHPDGFTGLNFHFLPPVLRLRLLSRSVIQKGISGEATELHELSGEGALGARGDKILLNWSKIKANDMVRPIVRRYKLKNVRSRYLPIDPKDFILAAMLPLARFRTGVEEKMQKVPERHVFRDTRQQILQGM